MDYYRPLRDNEILTDVKRPDEPYGRLIINTNHAIERFIDRLQGKTFKELKTKYGVKRQKKTRTILPPKTKGTKGRTGRKMGSIRKKL